MTAIDVLYNICNKPDLFSYPFRYCLVDEQKRPFTIDEVIARPNHSEDFCDLSKLLDVDNSKLEKYKGLGISVQASGVCAIDIDHCVENQFDVNSISPLAMHIINLFKRFAYIEFSFSGHGIRIFFQSSPVKDYEFHYYTKNSKFGIEYYYPEGSNRYVTITGMSIVENSPTCNNEIESNIALSTFLNEFMQKQVVSMNVVSNDKDNRSLEQLMRIVKLKYLNDHSFQDLWFDSAPGSGHDESERDYHLVAYIYDYVTKDKDKIKQIFEQSPFFKSKDWKHVNKWTKQDGRYFNYLYSKISSKGA